MRDFEKALVDDGKRLTDLPSLQGPSLAYVHVYGLSAARADLWPEYSHGKSGLLEHERAVRRGPLYRP
jgi:hypothetical protein